ncbi:helix-turn-helix domain-containing protein [Leptospira johnsonii]|nr:helix-turn-helix domain-containing protein [Leptospira johnsonii]
MNYPNELSRKPPLIKGQIDFSINKPIPILEPFVDSIWMLKNDSKKDHEVVVLPDGRLDIIFSISLTQPFRAMQMGLATLPEKNVIPAGGIMFAVSFKLLAIEYLLDFEVGFLLNSERQLPSNFWGISENDLSDFEGFSQKISELLVSRIDSNFDDRKQRLFQLIYDSNGTMPVKLMADKVFWSSRQINRYFKQKFGLSLKEYCKVIRFKSSLSHIKLGKLFPELDFSDQSHFIREIKKYSGTNPKELFRNRNDRFILLTAL